MVKAKQDFAFTCFRYGAPKSSCFQGYESKRTTQKSDFQRIENNPDVLPSLAFANTELIFRMIGVFAKAVKAKYNHKGNARVRAREEDFPDWAGNRRSYL